MKKNWPNQEKDLKIAQEIISKHLELNEGKPLDFLEVIYSDHNKEKNTDSYYIDVPLWIIELTNHFVDQYGITKGRSVAEKVLTKCFLLGQTIH